MLVKMTARIYEGRLVGDVFEVPDDEAAPLVASGLLVDVSTWEARARAEGIVE